MFCGCEGGCIGGVCAEESCGVLDSCFCENGVDDGEDGGNDFGVGGYLIATGGEIEDYC